jgi:hypothetical protein
MIEKMIAEDIHLNLHEIIEDPRRLITTHIFSFSYYPTPESNPILFGVLRKVSQTQLEDDKFGIIEQLLYDNVLYDLDREIIQKWLRDMLRIGVQFVYYPFSLKPTELSMVGDSAFKDCSIDDV